MNSEPESAPPRSPLVPSPYLDDGSRERAHASPLVTPAEELSAVPQERPVTPPMLPVSFQVKESTGSQINPWQPARLDEGPAKPAREYRIRKLDTLEDLAERFLGSKERSSELFEANRHVLQDPLVLPLGALIRIPPGSNSSQESSTGNDLLPVRPQQ
jgi:nucleoid-associated protein YgaU